MNLQWNMYTVQHSDSRAYQIHMVRNGTVAQSREVDLCGSVPDAASALPVAATLVHTTVSIHTLVLTLGTCSMTIVLVAVDSTSYRKTLAYVY